MSLGGVKLHYENSALPPVRKVLNSTVLKLIHLIEVLIVC